MANFEKKNLRMARIRWRRDMACILDHLLYDDKFMFNFPSDGIDCDFEIEAKKAMELRYALKRLRSSLLLTNEFSEMICND